MRAWRTSVTVSILWSLLILSSTRASEREEAIAAIRAKLAEAGNLTIQLSTKKTPGGGGWAPVENIERQLKHQPRGLLREAIDQAIRGGNKEERIAALGMYSVSVYMQEEPLNPGYHRVLLELLARDELRVEAYAGSIVSTLMFHYPSRETLLAIMDAARRAPTHEQRVGLLQSAAHLCGISWIDIQPESRGPRVEKVLSDFETWFAQNKDRIHFTKKGEFRLSGPKQAVERPELSAEDRQRIRQDPVCVLKLMNMTFGSDGEDLGGASALNSKCGSALFGVEGAQALSRSLSESAGGASPSLDAQANLSALAGQYPVVDAGILAAIYVAAYESDPKGVDLAKETLIQVSPADVKRIAKGEPGSVLKKAQALANPDREPTRD